MVLQVTQEQQGQQQACKCGHESLPHPGFGTRPLKLYCSSSPPSCRNLLLTIDTPWKRQYRSRCRLVAKVQFSGRRAEQPSNPVRRPALPSVECKEMLMCVTALDRRGRRSEERGRRGGACSSHAHHWFSGLRWAQILCVGSWASLTCLSWCEMGKDVHVMGPTVFMSCTDPERAHASAVCHT
eukprot:1160608-Pelagomonas_calceolata.AAC.3